MSKAVVAVKNTFVTVPSESSAETQRFGRTYSMPVSMSGRFSRNIFEEAQVPADLVNQLAMLEEASTSQELTPSPQLASFPPEGDHQPLAHDDLCVFEHPPVVHSGWKVAWIDQFSFKEANSLRRIELALACGVDSVSSYKTVEKFLKPHGKKICMDEKMGNFSKHPQGYILVASDDTFFDLAKQLTLSGKHLSPTTVRLVALYKENPSDQFHQIFPAAAEHIDIRYVDSWPALVDDLSRFVRGESLE